MASHKYYLSVNKFVPTLQKLPKEILEEIQFLTIFAKVNAIIQIYNIKLFEKSSK